MIRLTFTFDVRTVPYSRYLQIYHVIDLLIYIKEIKVVYFKAKLMQLDLDMNNVCSHFYLALAISVGSAVGIFIAHHSN